MNQPLNFRGVSKTRPRHQSISKESPRPPERSIGWMEKDDDDNNDEIDREIEREREIDR